MYKISKRFLAGFLAFLLVVTMLPADMLSVVYAAEEDEAVEAATAESEAPERVDAADEEEAIVETTKADEEEALNEDNKKDDDPLTDSEAEISSDVSEDKDILDVEDADSTVEEAVENVNVTDASKDISASVNPLNDNAISYKEIETLKFDTGEGSPAAISFTNEAGEQAIQGLTTTIFSIMVKKDSTKIDSKTDSSLSPVKWALATGGYGSKDQCSIKFKTENASRITVTYHPNVGRIAAILNAEGKRIKEDEAITGNEAKTTVFTLDEAGTYYLGSAKGTAETYGSIYIYEVKVEEKEEKLGFKENPSFTSTGNLKTPFDGDKLTVNFTSNEDETRTPVITWYSVSSENAESLLTADEGSDGKSYTIKETDRGSKIKAVVTFEAADGKDKIEESCTTEAAVTEKKFGFTTSPYLSGGNDSVLYPGDTLTLSYELNAGADADTSDIVWERIKDGASVTINSDAASKKTYTVTKEDIGSTIKVTVTPKATVEGVNKEGTPESSDPTIVVSGKFVTFTTDPSFSISTGGNLAYPQPDDKLTVAYVLDKAGEDVDESTITWTRVKADGTEETLTADAEDDTGKTYTIVTADVGSTIKATVVPKTNNIYVSDGVEKSTVSNEIKEKGFVPGKIYNMTLKGSDIPSGTHTSTFVKNGFTIHAGSDESELKRSVAVDANKKTINNTSYTARLKMSGPGTEDYRSVSFETVKEATLKIACMSNSNSSPATLKIAAADGEYSGNYKMGTGAEVVTLREAAYTAGGISINNTPNGETDGIGSYIEVVLPAGTYYLYTPENARAVNFYEIKVTYADGVDYDASDYVTITFDKNSGVNDIASQKIIKGEKCVEPAGPIKDGYTFKGWYKDAAGTEAYDFSEAVNADLKLYAAWEEDTTSENLVLDMKDLPQGDYTAAFGYRGFQFAAESDKALSVASSSATVNGQKYTQVLKLNGTGAAANRHLSFTTTEPSTVTIVAASASSGTARNLAVNKDSVVTDSGAAPTYTQEINAAYEWEINDVPAGTWYVYSMSSGMNIYYISVKPVSPENDDVLITPTISDEDLEKLDGAEVYFVAGTEKKKVTSGEALTLTQGVRYTLVIENDGTESETLVATIYGSTEYKAPSTADNVTITITAIDDPYSTLTFMNGDTVFAERQVEDFLFDMSTIDVSTLTPPEGKKFVGWGESPSSVELITGTIKVFGDRTFYAIFADENAKMCTVTFESKDGEELYTRTVIENETIDLYEPWFEEEGYTFAGWKIKGSDTDKVYMPEETYKVTGDVTFVETWKAVVYTVRLVTETGAEISKTEVEMGKEFTFPDTKNTKEGYFFAGWTSDNWESVYGAGQTYKVWEDDTFRETWIQPGTTDLTVKFFDINGDEITDLAKTIKAGDNPVIKLPETTTKRIGYVFEGWYDDVYCENYKAGESYTVTENVKFEESWRDEHHEKGMYIQLEDGEAYYQGGAAVTPPVSVYYNGSTLNLGTDYTVKYKNNKNAGPATVTVTGKNNFAGAIKKDVSFTISQIDINRGIDDYAGEMTVTIGAKVSPILVYKGKQLKLNKDFTISGDGLDNKGKYTAATGNDAEGKPKPNKLKVTGINNFKGSFEINVTVVEKNNARGLAIEIDKNFRPFSGELGQYADWDDKETNLFTNKTEFVDGQPVTTPRKITVFEKGDRNKKALVQDTDFKVVTISGNVERAGTVKFMVIGMGKYSGNVTKSFKVFPKPLADDDIEIRAKCLDETTGSWSYRTIGLTAIYSSTGSTLNNLEVRCKTGVDEYNKPEYNHYLTPNRDYKVSYSANKKVGTGKVKITFINDYKGTKAQTREFKITGASMSSFTAVAPDMVYSKAGKSYISKPIVEYDGTIIKASEYTVSYKWASASDIDKTDDTKTKYTSGANIRLEENDQYAKVKVTIEPSARSNFVLTNKDPADNPIPLTTTYYVRKAENAAADLSKAKVEFFADPACSAAKQYKKIPYCGSKFYTPEENKASNADRAGAVYVKVTVSGNPNPVDPSLYEVTWLNATNKGKATVVIVGKEPDTVAGAAEKSFAVGSKTTTIAIDSIGQWVDPPVEKGVNTFKNFLNKIF